MCRAVRIGFRNGGLGAVGLRAFRFSKRIFGAYRAIGFDEHWISEWDFGAVGLRAFSIGFTGFRAFRI